MAVCHFVVGGILSAGEYVPGGVGDNPNVVIKVTGSKANTVIAFCYLMIIVYALTLAPVCWIYAAEVWSLETRATGMGIAALGNWLFNFALGLYIPPGFQNIRWGLFIVFGCMCILAAIHFYFTYPEVSSPMSHCQCSHLIGVHRLATNRSRKSNSCSPTPGPSRGTLDLANPGLTRSSSRPGRSSTPWRMWLAELAQSALKTLYQLRRIWRLLLLKRSLSRWMARVSHGHSPI
jgi:Sugar (and other) transporter